jgi:hypothetical protein
METANMAIALRNNQWLQQHCANAVMHTVTGKEMEYKALMKDPSLQPLWKRGFGNKLGSLFQGICDIPGTDTCFFYNFTNIPKDSKITYSKIVCDYKPHKKEKERVWLTVWGGPAGLLWRCRNFHGGHHNIQNPHQQHHFYRRCSNKDDGHKKLLFGHSITTLWIHENVAVTLSGRDSWQVQPWRLIRWRLGSHWNQERPVRIETSGLACQPAAANSFGTIWILTWSPHAWTLSTQNAFAFSLIVDNFAVKYVGKQHVDHLRTALLQSYELKPYWAAKVNSCMYLNWDYKNRKCYISTPGYVSNVLSKCQHYAPKHQQHTPSIYVTPVYEDKTQYATKDRTSPLTANQCLTVQKVTGSVLYYARAVDPTVLMPLNDITTEQTKVTEKNQATTNQLLDYFATHPDVTIRYHASDMILYIHSDVSYLSVSNSCIRLGCRFSVVTNPHKKIIWKAQSLM